MSPSFFLSCPNMERQPQPLQSPLPSLDHSLAVPSMLPLQRQRALADQPSEALPATSGIKSRIYIPPLLNVQRLIEAPELPRSPSEASAGWSRITQDLPPVPIVVGLNDTEVSDVQVGSISLSVAGPSTGAAATTVAAKCTCSCLKRRRRSCISHGENNASSSVTPFKQKSNQALNAQKDLP